MNVSRDSVERLLAWFQENGRHELPWRQERTPYRVWVSEIMLQQTQVKTVLAYFSRFLSAFPDVCALAEAEEETVLRHWEGLGYYRRARQMHAAAKKVAEERNGAFPETFEEILALPGIGRYTAGAILSFALEKRFPILEANTQRLFARLNGLELPVSAAPAQKILWGTAEEWVSEKSWGSEKPSSVSPCTLNTALMDLGSLVCTPQAPNCSACPLARECEALRMGRTAELPVSGKKMRYENRDEAAVLIFRKRNGEEEREVLLLRYVEGEWWAGLWDLPRTQLHSETICQELSDFVRRTTGLEIQVEEELQTFRHAVTRYRIRLRTFRAGELAEKAEKTLLERTPAGGEIRWVRESELDRFPLCSTGRKIAELL